MFCSSATNKESEPSTDSTPAVIPTLFDVEPRKERGTVMWVYEEKHLEINECARRKNKTDFIHGVFFFFKSIIEYIFGVPGENQNKINSWFYLDGLDLHAVHLLISKSIRDSPSKCMGKESKHREAKIKIIMPKRPQTRSPEQKESSVIWLPPAPRA